ncbi:PQQ-binding-like beta-propeller repeat protein [Streptomyces sp. NPDC002773]|uniref:outer membrane protein assembly factor BamB family protein n=1 Tax=Streptomyces sp. NPDC002773 TaxID=3154430 RepID=UPI0033302776
MTRDGIAGAAFGAAAAFLGAGVTGGAWPTGWAALACALLLTAAGATFRATGRNRTATALAPAAAPNANSATATERPAEPADAVPGTAPTSAPASAPTSPASAGGPRLAKTADAPGGPAPAERGSGTGTGPGAGRSSLVVAAVVWVLALLAGGIWAFAAGDDGPGDTAKSPATATPTASRAPDKADVVWSVPAVGQKHDRGVGAWPLGATLAQGRLDGLFAYDSADGHVRWSVPAPAREGLCAMSPAVGQGVGLIAHGRHGKPCATLLAVRAADGKVLWKRSLGGQGLTEGALAVGGGTAVTAEDRTVRARSGETGEQRWERPLGKGCAIRALDADADRTLLVEQCGKPARLLALDTRTGAQRWARDLPVESEAVASVVSVSPPVIAVDEADARGTQAFLGFDGKGAQTATVPLTGPEGMLSAAGGVGDGQPTRPLVRDGLLVTLAERDLVPDKVVAYSLKDGRKAWEYRSENLTSDIAPEPDGRIAVLEGHGAGEIVLLDGATGKVTTKLEGGAAEGAEISIHPELLPVTGGRVVVNHIYMGTEPAAYALR